MMTDTEKSTILSAIRQILYCVGCFCVAFLQHAVAAVCKEKTFDENGILENLQLGELLLACVLFLIIFFIFLLFDLSNDIKSESGINRNKITIKIL